MLAGAAAGALFTLSIPKADLALLAWICLLPALYPILSKFRAQTVRAGALRSAVLLGLPYGVVSGLGRVYWLGETLQSYGGLSFGGAAFTSGLLFTGSRLSRGRSWRAVTPSAPVLPPLLLPGPSLRRLALAIR